MSTEIEEKKKKKKAFIWGNKKYSAFFFKSQKWTNMLLYQIVDQNIHIHSILIKNEPFKERITWNPSEDIEILNKGCKQTALMIELFFILLNLKFCVVSFVCFRNILSHNLTGKKKKNDKLLQATLKTH